MTRRALQLFLVSFLFFTACAPDAGPAAPQSSKESPTLTIAPLAASPAAPATTLAVQATLAPNPLNVKVKLDDKLSVSATISSTGGTVSVKAGDGTQFTLAIPPNALLDETKITLTPITGVDGLPFSGGLIGAVQMAPEGLRLFQQAILTIEPARATPAQGHQLVAFAYRQNGDGFYLTPSQAEGTKITIPIWHFSGGGAASGTAEEIKTLQRRAPANPEDALNQRMTDYLSQQQQLAQQGRPVDSELNSKTIVFLREYFNAIIKPQLAIAVQDCEASKAILPAALGWARSVQLWGLGAEFQAETDSVLAAFGDAIVNCYNKAYDKCVKDHDLSQLNVMIGLLRQATMLSPAEGGGLVARLDQSKVEKCGSFDFEMENLISGDATLYVLDYVARTVVPLRYQLAGGLPSGEAQVELDFKPRRGSADGYYKFLSSAAKGGSLQASLRLDTARMDMSADELAGLSVWLKPGTDTESFTAQYCTPLTGCGAQFSSDEPAWFIFFQFLHEDEAAAGGFEIRKWNKGNGVVLAHKRYDRTKSYNGHPVHETTTLQLIHKAH